MWPPGPTPSAGQTRPLLSTALSPGVRWGFQSPTWCLMSAFVTTLGNFSLFKFPGVFVYLPHCSTSWPGLSAQLPRHGVCIKLSTPGRPPLRLVGSRVQAADPGAFADVGCRGQRSSPLRGRSSDHGWRALCRLCGELPSLGSPVPRPSHRGSPSSRHSDFG